MSDDPRTLVSTDWLAAHLKDPDLRILDASMYMPDAGRDARAEYDAAHIPGARFFDLEEIRDARSDLPNTAPPAEKFMSRMRALGVGDGNQIVAYDGAGMLSAPRVWWLFRLMGHRDVAVLDGGFPKWQAEGRAIEDLPPVIKDRHLTARFQNHLVRDVTQVSQAAKLKQSQIVDARAAARFRGDAPEPREGLRAGHMPGAHNVPYDTLLNPDKTLKTPDQTRAVFEAAGIDLRQPIITSCGSGITAAILALALERMGHDSWSLYDGSWAEWGMSPMVPVATGDA